MDNIYDILNDIQSNLSVGKDKKNTFGNYNYRNAEDILDAVKPFLKIHKCVVLMSDSIEVIGDRYYVKSTCKLVGCKSKEEIETQSLSREPENKKGMDETQVTGSSSSYARKIALCALFAINATKDPDATNTMTNTKSKRYEMKAPVYTKVVDNKKVYGDSQPKRFDNYNILDFKFKWIGGKEKNIKLSDITDINDLNKLLENTEWMVSKPGLESAIRDRLTLLSNK